MLNSKLITLLQSFSQDEMKQFRKTLLREAEGKQLVPFFDKLYKAHPEFKEKKIEKYMVFRQLYPGEKYHDQKMRHLISELYGFTENFLVKNDALNDGFNLSLSLLQQFRKRNLPKLFNQQLKKTQQQLSHYPLRDDVFFNASLQADKEFNQFLKAKQIRTIEPNIQQLSNTLDQWFIISKLKIFTEALNYKNIVKIDYDIHFMDEILLLIRSNNYLQFPIVKVHYLALLTLLEPENEKHFSELKKSLVKHKKIFSREDMNDLNTLARNFCIKRINKGDKQYIREVFELYQFELNQYKGQEQVEMTPGTYKNIVTVAYSLNEYEYARKFIEQYTSFLPEAYRESNYNYNLARYHFATHNYNEVVGLLSQVEYDDIFLMLSAKALLLKTYYELNETDALTSMLQSFRVFLRNKKIISYHKTNYLNLIHYTEKLFKGTKSERKKLKEEILNEREIVDKEWLVDKAGNLTSSPTLPHSPHDKFAGTYQPVEWR